MSIVQFHTNEAGKKLSLVSLHVHECLYFDSIYSWLLFPLELIIFIFKGNMLYYKVFGGEIVFVLVLALVHALRYSIQAYRIYLGYSGNKGWSIGRLAVFIIVSLLEVAAFVFFLRFQSYTLYLEIGIFALAVVFVAIEIFLCIPAIIIYQMNSP
jgi:hypothetical protein